MSLLFTVIKYFEYSVFHLQVSRHFFPFPWMTELTWSLLCLKCLCYCDQYASQFFGKDCKFNKYAHWLTKWRIGLLLTTNTIVHIWMLQELAIFPIITLPCWSQVVIYAFILSEWICLPFSVVMSFVDLCFSSQDFTQRKGSFSFECPN